MGRPDEDLDGRQRIRRTRGGTGVTRDGSCVTCVRASGEVGSGGGADRYTALSLGLSPAKAWSTRARASSSSGVSVRGHHEDAAVGVAELDGYVRRPQAAPQ